nr:hypothetical protein [Tanacetum cinerariifolium]
MAARLLTEAGKKLLHLPSSSGDIINALVQMEQILSKVKQPPSKLMIKALHPISDALISNELMRHPDINVNISAECCICEILRITAPDAPYKHKQIKDFFEMVVFTFEKLASASGGYYGKMTKFLEIFSKARLPLLMLQLDGRDLIVRLFKLFLNASDCNCTAIILEMEKIMTMIIEENEELARELQALIITSLKKDNQIASPVCWQFGEKVLMICAAKLKPHPPDMSIALYDYPKMVARICETTSPMLKRKRDNEHDGDILVGRRIRVWCSKDENYRLGVVKLFDPIYKMHMVLYDDGYAEQIDLKCKRWILLEIANAVSDSSLEQELPTNVSSPQTEITCVEGYKVTDVNARILEAIIKKHGDIAAECVFKTPCVRESFLEVICEVVKLIETNDVRTIISKLEEIDRQVSEAQAANINVSWLQPHLEAIQKENKAQKKSSLLMETKVNTILVTRAAQTDLTERSMELVAAQKRFEIAERCVNVLDLVENKLNDNILESKAEKDSQSSITVDYMISHFRDAFDRIPTPVNDSLY